MFLSCANGQSLWISELERDVALLESWEFAMKLILVCKLLDIELWADDSLRRRLSALVV